ncbi:hypothetical protein AT5G01440 [Arabidopsis thaliana]|uniref:Coenzyme PQQ synthesis protein F-like C-terminal lobe domain-containing protein n=1 Tax=Arabidopsis thaliana TaxID=3702 RepID=F4K9D7_ARATH|nr:uncharacterized protein AT5G01440 [Arabidopsis thaliana]AED90344.1 hypothetical protein AT5G01440 [Arabidopsis thaliana]|eukprot:NP_195764.2 hypothetical protein AT5G01440 [Arabidopsis thaliana]
MSLREREIFPCAKRKTDVKVKNKFESNSLAKVYFRIKCEKAQEARQTALLNLFVSIISDSVYNKLRIEEKLGYLVECETRLIHGVGFYVCVVSSDYNPCHLVRRIYKFMNGIRLEGLFDKMFKDFKNGVSSKLPHDSGKTKWSEIVRESCIFDFYSEEKKELSLITKNDLIEWYKRYVRLSSPKCCSFVVSIWGCNTKNGLEKVKILRLRRKMKVKKKQGSASQVNSIGQEMNTSLLMLVAKKMESFYKLMRVRQTLNYAEARNYVSLKRPWIAETVVTQSNESIERRSKR